eukprot:13696706-Alexandrium_andersonii.AAC.1
MKSARGMRVRTYLFGVGVRIVCGADYPTPRTRERWEEGTMSQRLLWTTASSPKTRTRRA